MGHSYSTYMLECYHSRTDQKTTFHTNCFGNELDSRVNFRDQCEHNTYHLHTLLSGVSDPYTKDEQTDFAKWYALPIIMNEFQLMVI